MNQHLPLIIGIGIPYLILMFFFIKYMMNRTPLILNKKFLGDNETRILMRDAGWGPRYFPEYQTSDTVWHPFEQHYAGPSGKLSTYSVFFDTVDGAKS